MLLLLVGGLLAMIFRVELAEAGRQWLDPAVFNTMIGMHGWVMIASILLGIAGFANYLIPLMIGASDMAFPRLNSCAFWINVPAALVLLTSMFVGGWDTGWTAYPPLSALAPLGMQLYFVAVFFMGLSSILGAVNLIATILTHARAGHDPVSHAHLCLVGAGHQHHRPDGHPAHCPVVPHGHDAAAAGHGLL